MDIEPGKNVSVPATASQNEMEQDHSQPDSPEAQPGPSQDRRSVEEASASASEESDDSPSFEESSEDEWTPRCSSKLKRNVFTSK